jgi:RNA polymerase sigma factor for flagellar operon FliA
VIGALGLPDALDRYDPARGRRPTPISYRRHPRPASRSIGFRAASPKASAVDRIVRLLESRLGRTASEEEVARGLGLSLAAYRGLLGQIAPMSLVSLDDPGIGSGDLSLDRAQPDPLRDLLRRERLLLIADAIRSLPDRDQLLLSLYYRDELTMKEVGCVLGLTEARVSQLHTSALLRLRVTLEGSLDQRLAQVGDASSPPADARCYPWNADERPAEQSVSAARVARARALVRSRERVLDAEATARALIEAVLAWSRDQSGRDAPGREPRRHRGPAGPAA